MERCSYFAGHNLAFDLNILGAEWYRLGWGSLPQRKILDTKCDEVTQYCALPGGKNGQFKWPKLEELYEKLFASSFEKAHNAAFDIAANGKVLFELIKMGIIKVPECEQLPIDQGIVYQMPDLTPLREKEEYWEERKKKALQENSVSASVSDSENDKFPSFNSFHNYTQFSVLESTSQISHLVKKAAKLGSKALAITDNGNMYGCFLFGQEVEKYNKEAKKFNEENPDKTPLPVLKPVYGISLNICPDRFRREKEEVYKIILLAKNKKGYDNLCKLSSISFLEGFYYVPRIDRQVLEQYKEGLIALSGWLDGEIPRRILREGEEHAEKALQYYLQTFGDDFYLEIHRHDLPEEDAVNEVLLKFSKKYAVPVIASHLSFYLNPEDHDIHDLLLCIRDGETKSTPIGRGRGFRYGLPNRNFFFPDKDYIFSHFKDIPHAVAETQKLADKIEYFSLQRDVLLPRFDIPEEFLKTCTDLDPQDPEYPLKAEGRYLRHLTYEGAKKRYGNLTKEVTDRIEFELATVERMKYPGYFLIVQDFTTKAREMGVLVGPGRGSAAGSVISYCLGITNIDPLKYDLLFERFLNPDRISMPDIDIDFDDEGREKVMEYVIDKYGKHRVAQIITYTVLGGKSALRDTARVVGCSQDEINQIAKLFPEIPDADLHGLLDPKGVSSNIMEKIHDKPEMLKKVEEFRKLSASETPEGKIIRTALQLEGALRTTGVHACGVVITPDDVNKFIPVTRPNKEGTMMLTQYDNSVAESAGLLKMDFLGLKTLTILKDALRFIQERKGITLDIDKIPFDDKKTFELFQKGQTNGIFQFESFGMQKYLKELKPDSLSDLIAMNALFRPGPLQYIPKFINRKHGREPVTYELPEMEDILKETYGITVYQEQVMLLAQKLAGFSKGDADALRKAMAKKQKDILDKMKSKFISGCLKNNLPQAICEKIWKDWEAFASYAFNKSHSTCYAYLAYQMAYLKANYPSEFMCAVLNHQNDIEKISFFIEECYSLGIKVLPPDINESESRFVVKEDGNIRFGMAGIKGLGSKQVDVIVEERKKNGPYESIYDFARRHDTKVINKKTIEFLAQAGAFDSIQGVNRAMFFVPEKEGMPTLTEQLIKYCNQFKKTKDMGSASLFGETSVQDMTADPPLPKVPEWSLPEKLRKEKELVGFYLSDHPLNPYEWLMEIFSVTPLSEIKSRCKELAQKEVITACMVESTENKINSSGNPSLKVTLIDKSQENLELYLNGKNFTDFAKYFIPEMKLLITFFIPVFQEGSFFRPVIKKVELLDEIEQKINRHIRIKIDLPQSTRQDFISLEKILEKYRGKNSYEIQLIDSLSGKQFNFVSQEKGVQLSHAFINDLKNAGNFQISFV